MVCETTQIITDGRIEHNVMTHYTKDSQADQKLNV